ncbi:hypothetical protein [Alteromonas sp. 14N.309.X.WAT.G.H12]|uniref:hypothetical protein n=1 Tax=Alteromonas sp. 14N.309.X.WAT.G.H12 TaxID=3120824 RepID=UPI002FD073A0
MKHVLTLFSTVYLCIEIQAWLFLSKLYSTPLTANTLGDYERFGYASFGVGVSVLFFRVVAKKYSTQKTALALALIPLIYITSVWAVYEAVQRSSSLISDKPKSLASTIQTLSSPSWGNLSLYYFGNPKVDNDDVSRFMTLYPPSEKLIQASYISGIRNIALYAEVYRKAKNKLDRKVINALIKRGLLFQTDLVKNARFQKHLNIVALRQAINESYLWALNPWYNIEYQNAMDVAPVTMEKAKAYYNSHLAEIRFHSPRLKTRYTSDEGLLVEIDLLSWDAALPSFLLDAKRVRERELVADFLGYNQPPAAAPYLSGDDYFRYLVSQKIFRSLGIEEQADFPLIPWGENDQYTQEYAFLFGAEKIAPFFFNDRTTIVNFSDLTKREVRLDYIDKIRAGLNANLRYYWHQYQAESYAALSTDARAWQNPTDYALNKDLLRVGAILPLLLLLSTLMIIVNVALSLTNNKSMAIGVLFAVAFTLCSGHLWPEDILLKFLLPISVKAPQIFVF